MGARYQVLEVVGKGTFGQVAIALDGLSQQTVAIKVIKKKDIYMEQAMSEISILQHIMAFDPNDQFHIGLFSLLLLLLLFSVDEKKTSWWLMFEKMKMKIKKKENEKY